MEPTAPKLLRIAFDRFEVDLRSGELLKNGRRLRLQAQPFQLLALLLDRPGEVVTREEICRKLWQADTFVDFDHSLGTAMNKIREALGDSAEHPQFVETLPRRGFRFIGELKGSDASPPSESGAAALDADGGEAVDAGANKIEAERLMSAKESGPHRRLKLVLVAVASFALLIITIILMLRSMGDSRGTARAASIRSIAVLPLENLSGNPAQDYFADGMTDELITELARTKGLRVISRTSVMQYKGVHRPLKDIARELGVDGILEGSVVDAGGRVRVTVQLVHAASDTHVWAQSYVRDLSDLLLLQQEVAENVAKEVNSAALPARSYSPKISPEAHDAYLRGRYSWYKGEFQKSRDFFQRAIDLDPAYAAGYSGLADSYMAQCVSGELPAKEGMPKGEAAARKALEIDDSLAEAHNSLAAAKLFYRWDWPGAEKEIARALELNPSLSEAHHCYDYILSVTNRDPEALQQERIAQDLDPIARPWAIGWALLRQRRFDDAIRAYRSELESEPGNADLHMNLAVAYYFKGLLKEAITEEEKSLTLVGDTEGAAALASIYKSRGFKATLEWRFNALKKKAKKQYVSPVELAEFSAALGRQDEAVHYLKEAFDQHTASLIWLKQDPYFDSLHPDSRYQAIVKAIGLL